MRYKEFIKKYVFAIDFSVLKYYNSTITLTLYHTKVKMKESENMKKLKNKDVDALFEAILSLQTVEECYSFFEDACTIKEILEIAQRLKAAKMLKNGVNYVDISKETGMSTATISRVNKCLEYGNGGYNIVLERLNKEEN